MNRSRVVELLQTNYEAIKEGKGNGLINEFPIQLLERLYQKNVFFR